MDSISGINSNLSAYASIQNAATLEKETKEKLIEAILANMQGKGGSVNISDLLSSLGIKT
ncbi:MAG TPA: hypothetical protein VLE89_01020 [Chlamydiales bacterium]|nr:hypothetical protein [Chlamydiales bacterium]